MLNNNIHNDSQSHLGHHLSKLNPLLTCQIYCPTYILKIKKTFFKILKIWFSYIYISYDQEETNTRGWKPHEKCPNWGWSASIRFFYQQLRKLKSKRESYHIEFVIKSCYPQLAFFNMEEIEKFVNEFKSQNSFQIP